jgi:hypothetical protein
MAPPSEQSQQQQQQQQQQQHSSRQDEAEGQQQLPMPSSAHVLQGQEQGGADARPAPPPLATLQARLDALLGDFSGMGTSTGLSQQSGRDDDDLDTHSVDGIQVERVEFGGGGSASMFKNALPPRQPDFPLTYQQ